MSPYRHYTVTITDHRDWSFDHFKVNTRHHQCHYYMFFNWYYYNTIHTILFSPVSCVISCHYHSTLCWVINIVTFSQTIKSEPPPINGIGSHCLPLASFEPNTARQPIFIITSVLRHHTFRYYRHSYWVSWNGASTPSWINISGIPGSQCHHVITNYWAIDVIDVTRLITASIPPRQNGPAIPIGISSLARTYDEYYSQDNYYVISSLRYASNNIYTQYIITSSRILGHLRRYSLLLPRCSVAT